jgi:hypothetical protein
MHGAHSRAHLHDSLLDRSECHWEKGALRRLSIVERPITIRSTFASTLENVQWNPTIEQVCDRTGVLCFAQAPP